MSLDNFAPNLSHATSEDGIARALGVSTPLFHRVIECRDPNEIYRLHRIPKRAPIKRPAAFVEIDGILVRQISIDDADFRLVWESASPALKLAHKSVALNLDRYLRNSSKNFPHPNACGYIKGRSIRDNAAKHCGASEIVSADIRDFFPSITQGRVEIALREAGMAKGTASLLARFLTIDGRLPLGLNASPLIANYVALPLDVEFTAMAAGRGLSYTRYADDLTFSGEGALPTGEEIGGVLGRYGFAINERKYRSSKRGQKHYVTGLSVGDPARPHVPKHLKKRLRQEIYFVRKFGLDGHRATLKGDPSKQSIVNRLEGMISYVTSIEPHLTESLWPKWREICVREGLRKSFSPRPFVHLRDAHWFVDEAEFRSEDGTALLAVVCVEVHDLDASARLLRGLSDREAEDPYIDASAANKLRRGIIHWSEMTMSQKSRLVEALVSCNFHCRVAFSQISDSSTYEGTYCELLTSILDSMFRSADDADVQLTIEQNSSKVSASKIDKTVQDIYQTLVQRNERRPSRPPSVSISAKGESIPMCIADAMLGVLQGYLAFEGRQPTEPFLFYKRLEPRFQLIVDMLKKTAFHRSNPLLPWSLRK